MPQQIETCVNNQKYQSYTLYFTLPQQDIRDFRLCELNAVNVNWWCMST